MLSYSLKCSKNTESKELQKRKMEEWLHQAVEFVVVKN